MPSFKSNPSRRTTHRIDFDAQKIDQIFQRLDRCDAPGAAVGISVGGVVVYRKGFGLANAELPCVLSPSIRMRIHSTSKHFTCFAYLLLCEKGAATLDDPIGKFLPEMHPAIRSVTARQLMGHVSGLRDAHDLNWQFSGTGHEVTSEEIVSFYRDTNDVNFAPGTSWCYNNGGYTLLSAAMERITGRSFEDVLRTEVFEPIGMYDTLLRRRDTDFVLNSATPHSAQGGGHAWRGSGSGFKRKYQGTESAGEGGIVSTVDDMLRWLAHMDAPTVGSAASWELLKTPQILDNGTSTGYGFGLIIGRYRGVDILNHPGGSRGSNAQMLKVPGAELDIVVLVNRDDVSSQLLANEIVDACITDLEPATSGRSQQPVAKGTFHSPTTGRVIQLGLPARFAWNEGTSQIISVNAMETAVEPDATGVLRPIPIASFIQQSVTLIGDPQEPRAILFSDFGNRDELVRVEPIEVGESAKIVGHYRSNSTHTDAIVTGTEQGVQLKMRGRFGSVDYRLDAIGPGLWRATSQSVAFLGGILSFESGAGAFRFSNYRTWALPFIRVADSQC